MSAVYGDSWGGVSTRVRILSRLKYCALAYIFRMCWPAVRLTPPLPTHWNVPHDPVLGAATTPVTSIPSISMWKLLLLNWLLTSASSR